MGNVYQSRTPGRRAFEEDEPFTEAAEPSALHSLARGQEDATSVFGGSAAGADPLASGLMVEATVKWFNAEKGYGFVELTSGRGDAFVHLKTLRPDRTRNAALGRESFAPSSGRRLARRAGGCG